LLLSIIIEEQAIENGQSEISTILFEKAAD
jgi:hypothetical protein